MQLSAGYGEESGLPMKQRKMIRFFVPLGLLLLWYLAALLLNRPVLPDPVTVITAMFTRYPLELLQATGASLMRVFFGVVFAAVMGLLCALLAAVYPGFSDPFYTAVYFLHPIPKIALLPIAMLLLGMGEASKITIIFLICFFQFVISARDAIAATPTSALMLLCSLGANRLKLIRYAYFPAAIPGLFTGLRLSLGTALSVLFFTETFGTKYGLGAFIVDAWMRVSYSEMYAGILMLSLVGFALYKLVDTFSARRS